MPSQRFNLQIFYNTNEANRSIYTRRKLIGTISTINHTNCSQTNQITDLVREEGVCRSNKWSNYAIRSRSRAITKHQQQDKERRRGLGWGWGLGSSYQSAIPTWSSKMAEERVDEERMRVRTRARNPKRTLAAMAAAAGARRGARGAHGRGSFVGELFQRQRRRSILNGPS